MEGMVLLALQKISRSEDGQRVKGKGVREKERENVSY